MNNSIELNHNVLINKDISLRAKGLLALLLTFEDVEKITEVAIVEQCKESRDAVKSAIKELETYGYLYREQRREGGKFCGYIYHISQEPILN